MSTRVIDLGDGYLRVEKTQSEYSYNYDLYLRFEVGGIVIYSAVQCSFHVVGNPKYIQEMKKNMMRQLFVKLGEQMIDKGII